MKSEWRMVKVAEVAEVISGATPRTGDATLWGGTIPWLTPKDLSNRPARYTEEGERFLTQSGLDSCSAALVPAGTVLLTSRAPIGYVSIASRPLATNQGFKSLKLDGTQDPLFWFYMLGSSIDYLISQANGSTFKELSSTVVKNLTFLLPQLEVQRKIASVLGALDSLIETDKELINSIDRQVRQLGRQLLEETTVRPTVAFSEVADITKGYSYKSDELVRGGGWLVNLKNVGRGGEFQARGFKPLSASVKQHHILHNGSVVVAQTDLTQDREVIARPVRVRRGDLDGPLIASLDLVTVRPKEPYTEEALFALLDTPRFRNHALGYCNGTTVLHMGSRAIPDFKVSPLTREEIEDFTNLVSPLREAADELFIEVAELEAARNRLLPLLLRGRIDVGSVSS